MRRRHRKGKLRRAVRRRRPIALVCALIALLLGGWLADVALTAARRQFCDASAGRSHYRLDTDQAANATTIAAVGRRLGMPDHAVSIALATALRESNLHNIHHGDRDSLGLFQQRPSQGWGTPAEIMQPWISAAAFYQRLVTIPGWQNMQVTEAAQAVQRSAVPKGYAKFDNEGRVLARALTGELAASFTCQIGSVRAPRHTAPIAAALQRDLGSAPLGVSVSPAEGWTAASWLVGHAKQYSIPVVYFAGQRWSAKTGTWARSPGDGRLAIRYR